MRRPSFAVIDRPLHHPRSQDARPRNRSPRHRRTVRMPPNEEHKNETSSPPSPAVAPSTVASQLNVAIMLISFTRSSAPSTPSCSASPTSPGLTATSPSPTPQRHPRHRRSPRSLAHQHPLARLAEPSATSSAPATMISQRVRRLHRTRRRPETSVLSPRTFSMRHLRPVRLRRERRLRLRMQIRRNRSPVVLQPP